MVSLEVSGLKKSFGKFEVLKDVSFKVVKGRTLGFIGKNGAGKTTTMKIIMGLMARDGGVIKIGNEEINSYLDYKGIKIGYLPDVPEFYSYMKPKEYLRLCGDIMGLAKEEGKAKSKELLELFELGDVNKKIGSFSRGMKQRLGMAQALLGDPEILLCDEPTSALDPIGRHDILKLMEKIKARTTIVFSTHILADVEEVCDDIAVLNGGKILYWGGIKELKDSYSEEKLRLEFLKEEDLLALKEALPLDFSREDLSLSLKLEGNKEELIESLWQIIHDRKIKLKEFKVNTLTLEDIFMEMIE